MKISRETVLLLAETGDAIDQSDADWLLRQDQWPAFAIDGNLISLAEMNLNESESERSRKWAAVQWVDIVCQNVIVWGQT